MTNTETPATFTFNGETRPGTFGIHAVDATRGFVARGLFVATIGAGSAKYPTMVSFRLASAGTTAKRGEILATLADGRVFLASGAAVVRNRPARVTGWAEDATNAQNQTRA